MDNVLIAFEVIHYMRRKNYGSSGEVALKLDVSKAYDRASWSYLFQRVRKMGFNETWVNWMLLCVTTVSYNINFNGSQIGPINPRRGLRQGDFLSPYLFLFCVEGLSHLLKEVADRGKINGCKSVLMLPPSRICFLQMIASSSTKPPRRKQWK